MAPEIFLDYLHGGATIDAPVIVGGAEMDADLCWNFGSRITDYGIERFRSLLESSYTLHDSGCIEIHCDDYELGKDFLLAAAGYIGQREFDRIFSEVN